MSAVGIGAVETPPDNHPGVADGEMVNGEKVVYEYDESGALIGWHKESAGGAE